MSESATAQPTGSPWQIQRCVTRHVYRESADTVTLHLEPTDDGVGQRLREQIAPGQFCMLYLFGQGEAPISISGVSKSTGCIQHTVKDNGALTRALTQLRAGDLVGLRGPFGNGWPLAAARGRDLLLIAGGIGFAPIRAALRAVLQERANYGQVDVVYGARGPEEFLFRDQLAKLEGANLHQIVDQGDAAWEGPVGFVTAIIESLQPSPTAMAMLCGPEVMMRHVLNQLLGKGLSPERVFLSIERNMKCALGVCGHCQWGPDFICRDGPVLAADRIRTRLQVNEL